MEATRIGRRLVIIAAVGFGTLIVAIWIVIGVEPFKHKSMSYDVLSCKQAKVSSDAKLTSHWDKDDFVISASACSNCSDHVESVSAQAIGNFVLIQLHFVTSSVSAACNCEHPTIARLSELQKRDYKVLRIGSPWIDLSSCTLPPLAVPAALPPVRQ